jgi:SAM-dependent methyltransferase
MFLTDRDIPRPSKLVGITNAISQHQRSKERVSLVRSSDDDAAQVSVDLYCGDAVCRDATSPTHPLHVLNPASFDIAVVLDCAYHFDTREVFLAQVYQKLTPGGRVVLGDICFAQEPPPGAIGFLTTKIMPKENIVSPQEYIQLLEKLGYTEVELEDITSDSFTGLCKFLSTRGALWYIYSRFLNWFMDSGGARFVVITARKRSVDSPL